MPKFYKFKTATVKRSNLEDIEKLVDLGIEQEIDVEIEYRELPIRVDHIVYYYPLKTTNLSKNASEKDILHDDELFIYAKYINVVMLDGTEFTIQHDIEDFEELLETL